MHAREPPVLLRNAGLVCFRLALAGYVQQHAEEADGLAGRIVLGPAARYHPACFAFVENAVFGLIEFAGIERPFDQCRAGDAIVRMDQWFECAGWRPAVLVERRTEHALEICIAVHACVRNVPIEYADFACAQCRFQPPSRRRQVMFDARAHDRAGGLFRIEVEDAHFARGKVARFVQMRQQRAQVFAVPSDQRRRLHGAIAGERGDGAVGRVARFGVHVPNHDPPAVAQRAGTGGLVVDGHRAEDLDEFRGKAALRDDAQRSTGGIV